jgi:hypothetical protein
MNFWEPKSLFKSRTFWFNAATGIVAILSASDVVKIIPTRYAPAVSAVVAGINIILRLYTTEPVSIKPLRNT